MGFYKEAEQNPNFPALEEAVLAKWKKEKTFKASINGAKEFIFYDGPPFANGLPHHGHLLCGFIKDVFARYQTMLGKKVERRFGWDCHGLPAEMPAEKALNVSGKVAIEAYGIDKFNDYCKTSVLNYTKEWEKYVTRQARWVDFENDYKTMDINYMESVLWAFKTLYDKGLIYESQRVMPYSWACETPVSDFETKMDNAYREKKSKAVTFDLKLCTKPSMLERYEDVRLLVWTTTPWTIPSDLAAAVGSKITYALVIKKSVCYIVAKNLLYKYESEIGNDIVGEIDGEKLVGHKYVPPFDYFKDHENAFVILSDEFVTTEDGTGIVHLAPAFGEDDYRLCQNNNIDLVCPVDSSGRFTHPVSDYIGKQVFETEDDIIKALKAKGSWVKTEQYIHNYPHCWRTDTPLIYKAVPSWYLKVTAIKDDMIKNNNEINWIPSHIKDGLFGKWIENARDWSISRNRYFGCPVPVWQSDDPAYPNIEVYGSITELEEAFGVKIKDLHRPFIDKLVKPNSKDPTGQSVMRRVPEVLDCWFESGSMPYAQAHYPFENKDWFEKHFPADFIVEYLAQTRGWFYTLLVLSTALFNRPPFKNCICHGVILGEGGAKLSKRLQNYVDPNEVFDTLGADALRWFMLSSPVMRGQELVIKDQGAIKDVLRLVIKPIWNAYNFFVLYANADNIKATFSLDSEHLLDRYIISKCCMAIRTVKESMDQYDTITATSAIEEFFEVLNNWYIRRSRERFWRSEKDVDKVSAYNTLYSVLKLMLRASAPLLPLVSEYIYQGLHIDDESISIHLETFPIVHKIDAALVQKMERVRDACNATLNIRNKNELRIRQPLAKVTFIGVADDITEPELQRLILDEINVKAWEVLDKSEIDKYANFKLHINFPILGKRIPGKVKDVIAANKSNIWKIIDGKIEIAGEELISAEFELKLEPKEQFNSIIAPTSTNDSLVLLDITLSDELRAEGYARDVVRAIQQMRKDAGLRLTDRIVLCIESQNTELFSAIKEWEKYIADQTLCDNIAYILNNEYKIQNEVEVGEGKIIIQLLCR